MKKITLDALPKFIQDKMLSGHTVTTTVRKGSKVVAELTFRFGELHTESEVRIPCVVVPRSPFWPKEKH